MVEIIISSVTQGLVWAVMAIGVHITFRILDIADLSAEGVFPLGAIVTTTLMTAGVNPFLATLVAMVAGGIAGSVAGFIHTKLNIPPLLTGILVLTGVYSINLRIASGSPNISIYGLNNIYTAVQNTFQFDDRNIAIAIVAVIILVSVIALLLLFFRTELGLALCATGDNERMSAANGINTNRMKTWGYIIGNALIALAGAMVAQKDGYSDIQMGIGTIVIGLASIIICEVIIPNKPLTIRFPTIIMGSIIYRLIIDAILNQNFVQIETTDLRLFQAILLTLVLFLPELQKKTGNKRRIKQLAKAQGGL